MLNKDDLDLLQSIRDNKFDFTGLNIHDLTEKLLLHIGVKDGEVRDNLVYPVLAHLFHDDLFDNEYLDSKVLQLISDDYLFYDMNNKIEYSVLKRSFTLLQLAILVYKHNQKQILSNSTFTSLSNKFLDYFEQETYLTGYKKDVGWCHTIAHSADLFAQIFKNDNIDRIYIEKALLLIQNKFMIKHYQYTSDEDERMVNAIENAVKRDVVSQDFITDWIIHFKEFEKGNIYPDAYHITLNVKRLLRSLYFKFLDNKNDEYISKICHDTLSFIK